METTGQTFYVPFLQDGTYFHFRNRNKQRSCFKKTKKTLFIAAVVVSLLTTVVATLLFLAWPETTMPITMLAGRPTNGDAVAFQRPADISLWAAEDFTAEFDVFVSLHSKNYKDEAERTRRMAIFQKNLVYISVHNEQNLTFSLEMNQFGDMTHEEFRQNYVLSRPAKNKNGILQGTARPVDWSLAETEEADIPHSVDWRAKGCVTEVKNQEQCGSCWAFSTTGAVEGAICRQTGVLPDLSEQQLVDCANPEGNFGCDGGEADWGFQYIIDNGGLCTEESYPYLAKAIGYCAAKDCKIVGNIRSFNDVPPMNEKALRAAVAKYGPVSVAIEADQAFFMFYKEGVFMEQCGTDLDHATLVVGYGTDDETGVDYFIMKNSWGISWGEEGYMRLARHTPPSPNPVDKGALGNGGRHQMDKGECGILMQASYAAA